jgi:hypothetical protein
MIRVISVILVSVFAVASGSCAQEVKAPAATVPGDKVPVYDIKDEQEGLQAFYRKRREIKELKGSKDDRIIACMKDPDYRIRLLGIEFVHKKSSAKVMDALLDLLKDNKWWVRENAGEKLYAVFNEAHKENILKVISLLASRWPSVRANAVLALANVKDPRILPAIKHMVNDPDGHVVPHALMALGKQGGQEAVDIVFKETSRPDAHNWVTWYGLDALVAMKAADKLMKLAVPSMKRTYVAANLELLKLGETGLMEEAVKIANDENMDLRHRNWAVNHLKRAGYKGELPLLKKEYFNNPETPRPEGSPPKGYTNPHPWSPRLFASDLGRGKVLLGWSVTRDRNMNYKIMRTHKGGRKLMIMNLYHGSYEDTVPKTGVEYTYWVENRNKQASAKIRIIPRTEPPEIPELVHVIRDDKHPVFVKIPGLNSWSCEWNLADLDMDGYFDFMVGQTAARKKRAYTWQGKLLWERPYTRGSYYTHPVRMVAADLDRDGKAEMVCFEENGDEKWLIVCDAETGAVKHYKDMNAFTIKQWERRDKILLIDRKGSGHEDTIVFIHNNYGNPQAVAFTPELKHIWSYTSDWSKAHKSRIIDLNGDGRDEMILGGDCIDADGKLVWKMPGITCRGHADYIEARDLDPRRPGLEIAAAGCDSATGWLTDWQGKLIWVQHRGHAQWLVAGHFGKKNEPEVWIRRKMGNEISDRVALDGTRIGEPSVKGFIGTIDWDGDRSNGDEIILWHGQIYQPSTGKFLFRIKGGLKGDKRAADVIGDSREELIHINQDKRQIEIYAHPKVNPKPLPDRHDNGWWRYKSKDKKPYGRDYINPPS